MPIEVKNIVVEQIVYFILSFYKIGLRMTITIPICNLTSVKVPYTLVSPVYKNSETHFCDNSKSHSMASVLIVEDLCNKVDYRIILLLFITILRYTYTQDYGSGFRMFCDKTRFKIFFNFGHQQHTY